MSYEEAFAAAWSAGGHKGALDFLRQIFHDPENQKIQGEPTDYLNDEDDEQVSPAYGFDRMLKLFAHRWMQRDELLAFIVDNLDESRGPETDQKHRIQPFNGFVAFVETYGHGDASMRSIHVANDTWKTQYGLNHQVIGEEDNYDPETEDDEDSYDFIYELESDDRYTMMFEGDEIDGSLLFKHVRTAQYAGVIEDLVHGLFATDRFAAFPKALPFHCFVSPASTYDDSGPTEQWFPVSVWTEASFAEHPLREAILASAVPPPEPTREENWAYLLGYVRDADSDEVAALLDLLSQHDDLRAKTIIMADAKLTGAEPPADLEGPWAACRRTSALAWARLLWGLEAERPAAIDYTRRMFDMPPLDLGEFAADRIPQVLEGAWDAVETAWEQVPQLAQDELRTPYQRASDAIRNNPHPVARVLFAERDLRAEHGEDAVVIDSWEPAAYAVDVPDSLIEALVECIDLMPQKFNGYGGLWDFVMKRLEGLGTRSASAIPRVDALLTQYESVWCDDQLAGGFARALYAMGMEEPPALIRARCERNQYHNIDCYKPWAARVPNARRAAFLSAFEKDTQRFGDAARWDEFLVDSTVGRDLLVSAILEHERCPEIIDLLAGAAADASELLSKLVASVVGALNKRTHMPSDQPKTAQVVALLSALRSRDDAQEETLRRARFLLARFDVDAGGDGGLDALLADYPSHPVLHFLRAELAERTFGPAAAGAATLEALQALSETDMVYRKAFFHYAGVTERSWDRAEPWHGLVAYRWAQDHNKAENYRNGEFARGQSAMSADPFYEGLEKIAASRDDTQLEDDRREAQLEIAFGEELLTLSDDELAERLSPESWNIAAQICRRLAPNFERYDARLLDAYRWFHADENRRMTLASLFWPFEGFRPALLADDDFAQDIDWLIHSYPGIGRTEMARLILGALHQMGHSRRALDIAKKLPADTVIGCFLTVNQAIDSLEAFDEGVELLTRFRDETSPKKPEYMLLGSNVGVLLFRKGDRAAAVQNFDELFAMDWSRFDYQPNERASLVASFMGGDLNAQIADVFRQYFAMAKYNAACAYANYGRETDAVGALRDAATMIPERYTREKFEGETDFVPLHGTDAYDELLASLGGE